MAYRVVCISRMTAAGGEPIGRPVADRLGFRYVDDEVIALAAERAGLEPAVVEAEEHHKSLLARLMDALIAPPTELVGYLGLGREQDTTAATRVAADGAAGRGSPSLHPERHRRDRPSGTGGDRRACGVDGPGR